MKLLLFILILLKGFYDNYITRQKSQQWHKNIYKICFVNWTWFFSTFVVILSLDIMKNVSFWPLDDELNRGFRKRRNCQNTITLAAFLPARMSTWFPRDFTLKTEQCVEIISEIVSTLHIWVPKASNMLTLLV